jgi:hypothetical protein
MIGIVPKKEGGYVGVMRGIRSSPLMRSNHLYIGIPEDSCPKMRGIGSKQWRRKMLQVILWSSTSKEP